MAVVVDLVLHGRPGNRESWGADRDVLQHYSVPGEVPHAIGSAGNGPGVDGP